MEADFVKNLVSFADVWYLTGPVLDKELRVLSRQKRYYIMRSGYIAILIFFTLAVFSGVALSSSSIYSVSRMAESGRFITVAMVIFQFLISQVLAVVFLSAAISEEMHKRTLGILMTTPVSSLQIVLGKYFSRLLILLLLLALALPLLAIIRVFGGVPGDFLISSFFVILTSGLFAGSVSLFFSIFSRHGLQTVSKTIFFFFLFYGFPQIVRSFAYLIWEKDISLSSVGFANPFVVLFSKVRAVLDPRYVDFYSGALCCVVMLSGAVLFLILSTIFVRKAALAQMTGQTIFASKRKERLSEQAGVLQGVSNSSGRILPVKGPPVIWKDVMIYFASARKIKSKMGIVLFITILLIGYGYGAIEKIFDDSATHTIFICSYLLLGLLQAASLASASITSEREAKTWELLMTTTLTDKQIALGKIAGSAIRSWPFLFLAIAHIVVFTFLGCIHYAAILPIAAVFIGSFFLASAAGVMVSSLCRRSLWSSGITMFIFICAIVPFCSPGGFLGNPLFLSWGILSYTAGKDAAAKTFTELVYGSTFLNVFGYNAQLAAALFYLAGVLAIYFLGMVICYLIAKNNVRFRIY